VGGRAPAPVLRSGGKPGDDVWVTGALGLSAEAFLAERPRAAALAHFRRPAPRVAFAQALADAGLATAMMDLSDGLRADLARLCSASGCGATVDPAAIPGEGPLAWRVAFGEDYELLFTAAADRRDEVLSLSTMHATPIARVGRLEPAAGLRLQGGSEWPAALFAHFSQPGSAEPVPRGDA
jgi:thiamine-monophosphate kinase